MEVEVTREQIVDEFHLRNYYETPVEPPEKKPAWMWLVAGAILLLGAGGGGS